MKRITALCLLGVLLSAISARGAAKVRTLSSDSIGVTVTETPDSMTFRVVSWQIETQLTFLMQGLSIRLGQADSLTLSFPSAAMVRRKMRRHPNEVKASFAGRDSMNQIVRPDVMPLLAALNDTTASVASGDSLVVTHDFGITVDRETEMMVFSIRVGKALVEVADGVVELWLRSQPMAGGNRAEFRGNRLSREHAPQPNGLGEGLRKEDMASRTLNRRVLVKIDKNDGQ